MIDIVLCSTSSEVAAVDKQITELATVQGALRNESSVINPVIEIDSIDNYISNLNYIHIPSFGRYYFVRGIESVRNGLWRISAHVDVLYTYRNQIRSNKAIIARNEIAYDLKLNDGLFKTQQNPRIAQFEFPNGFTNWNFVLAIAGN